MTSTNSHIHNKPQKTICLCFVTDVPNLVEDLKRVLVTGESSLVKHVVTDLFQVQEVLGARDGPYDLFVVAYGDEREGFHCTKEGRLEEPRDALMNWWKVEHFLKHRKAFPTTLYAGLGFSGTFGENKVPEDQCGYHGEKLDELTVEKIVEKFGPIFFVS